MAKPMTKAAFGTMAVGKAREFARHVISWQFLVGFAITFGLDAAFQRTAVARGADRGGFDSAIDREREMEATGTAVVGITTNDVTRFFGGRRPVSPSGVDSVVTRLLRLEPSVLVVDILTDGPGYDAPLFSDTALLARQERIIWAEAVDPATGMVLPALSGLRDLPGRTGLATLVAGDDQVVRTVRLRYGSTGLNAPRDSVPSLPLVAALAHTKGEALRNIERISDTSSTVIRRYTRLSSFYLLEDLMAAARRPREAGVRSPLEGRILVLGFVDGSDQVTTSRGLQSGPEVVADAIETLLDERKAIVRLPGYLDVSFKVLLALLVVAVHLTLKEQRAMIAMVVIATAVVFSGFVLVRYFGYWSSYILIVAGMWIEELYSNVTRTSADERAAAGGAGLRTP